MPDSEGKAICLEPLTLRMTFPEGQGCLKIGLDHPLATVFRRSATTGRATGNWLYLAARPAPSEALRLIGTVAWTPGKRFLFFPGKFGEVHSTHPDKSLNGHELDHITLKLDGDVSGFEEHVAVLGNIRGKTRGQKRRGKIHQGWLHPWFSLVLPSLEGYQCLPAMFELNLAFPSADVQRRASAMMCQGKRTDIGFAVPEGDGPHYFQLDVWAGCGQEWKNKRAVAIPFPDLDGVIAGHRGESVTVASQSHDIAENCGIKVVLSRPSGCPATPGLVHASIKPANLLEC